jgi:hypothetical protein
LKARHDLYVKGGENSWLSHSEKKGHKNKKYMFGAG